MALFLVCLILTACTPPASTWIKPETQTLACQRYSVVELEGHALFNNVWNLDAAKDFPWKQCLEQKLDTTEPVYGWSWHWPAKGRDIFAYPQVKVGTSPWTPNTKKDPRFPVLIKDINSLQVSHELEATVQGEFNVATSMWLTNTSEIGDKQNSGIIVAELMIWTYATENHMTPAGKKVGYVEEGGNKWSVWLHEDWADVSGQHENKWVYLTFKAEHSNLRASFDVRHLLKTPLIAHLNMQDMYIADIEVGTEIMSGDGLVWVKDFNVRLDEVSN